MLYAWVIYRLILCYSHSDSQISFILSWMRLLCNTDLSRLWNMLESGLYNYINNSFAIISDRFCPNIISITRYFRVNNSVNLQIVDYFYPILDVLVYTNTNYICYRRFYQYKNNEVMDKLLFQYRMWIITVIIMDTILCSLTFIFVDRALLSYNLISIVMIGLIMEYFLLYRLRNHVMYLIQQANAYN